MSSSAGLGFALPSMLAAALLWLAFFGSHRAPKPQERPLVRLTQRAQEPEAAAQSRWHTPRRMNREATLLQFKPDQLEPWTLVLEGNPRPPPPANNPAFFAFPEGGGLLASVMHVEPEQLLSITARARVRNRQPKNPYAGLLVVLPLQRWFDLPLELQQHDLTELLASLGVEYSQREAGPLSAGEDFQEMTVSLSTPADSRALFVGFHAGEAEPGRRVDLADLSVRECSIRRFAGLGKLPPSESPCESLPESFRLPDLGLRPVQANAGVWQVECAGELRESLLLPAPAEVSLEVTLPAGRWTLECALARLQERRSRRHRLPVLMQLRIEALGSGSAQLLSDHRRMLAADAEEGWHPWQLDVSEAGGRKVRLTFAADPPAVATGGTADLVAVGSPLLRSQDRSSDLPPIVMISIDTLRPDHLGAFGYSRPTSPFLDSLAAATISFENASSTSAYTLPAHASLLTGQLPAWHRALSAVPGRNRVSPESRLLSELLADRGYVTAAFTGGGYLSPDFGFARGFDLYSTLDCLASDRDPAFTDHPRIHDREGNLQLRRRRRLSSVLDWIGRHRSQPFFLFLHTYAVHNYYPEDRYFAMFSRHGGSPEAPLDRVRDRSLKGPIPAEELESLIDRYDASIRQVDEQLRQLVTYLKDQRLWNRTILVLTSDHGEEFSDHGGMSHGRSLYQEMVHVPLLLHLPTRQPQIIAEPVSLVDVTPTLLDWLDWPGESPLQGQSLLGLLADTPAEGRPLVAELNLHPYHWQMLRQQNFKFLRPDPGERSSSQPALLFDLEQDPQEQRNLLPKQPNLGKNLAAELDRLLSSAPVPESSEGEQELDSAMRRQLEALGYTLEEPNEQ